MLINELNTYLSAQMPGKDIQNNFFVDDSSTGLGDEQIMLMDMGGTPSIRSTVVIKTFDVWSRSLTYTTAATDITTIYNLLKEAKGVLTTPTQIIKAETVPTWNRIDENRRFYFRFRFIVRATGI